MVAQAAPLAIVYHYTLSAALPFIMERGEVHCRYTGTLDATESKNFEKTDTNRYAAGNDGVDPYRNGGVARVRFACHAEDFEYRGDDNYTRATPLPLDRVIACDTRTYLGHKWVPFDLASRVIEFEYGGEDCHGVEIGGKVYASYEEQTVLSVFKTAHGYAAVQPFPFSEMLEWQS